MPEIAPPVILADIGGTHARFAALESGRPVRPEKLPAAEFLTLEDALRRYGSPPGAMLHIATAAWPDAEDVWRFARPNRWTISPAALRAAGWRIGWMGNDFAAAACAAPLLPSESRLILRGGVPQDTGPALIIGAGTGLGLAYSGLGDSLRTTYGGHMDLPRRTAEQEDIARAARALKAAPDAPLIAEDIVSGPGLSLLYESVCMLHGVPPQESALTALLANRTAPQTTAALRLFHEFLGLCAQNAALYADAFSSLYLDGGVLHALHAAGALESATLLRAFSAHPHPVIAARLAAVPVFLVTDPFAALHGVAALAAAFEKDRKNAA